MSSAADQQKITIYEVVDDIRETSQDEREKGDRFERAIRYFLKKRSTMVGPFLECLAVEGRTDKERRRLRD